MRLPTAILAGAAAAFGDLGQAAAERRHCRFGEDDHLGVGLCRRGTARHGPSARRSATRRRRGSALPRPLLAHDGPHDDRDEPREERDAHRREHPPPERLDPDAEAGVLQALRFTGRLEGGRARAFATVAAAVIAPTLSAAAGKKLASSRPAIRPTMIWPTRLVRVSR